MKFRKMYIVTLCGMMLLANAVSVFADENILTKPVIEASDNGYKCASSYNGCNHVFSDGNIYDVTGRYILAADTDSGLSDDTMLLDEPDVFVGGINTGFENCISYRASENRRTFGVDITGDDFIARSCLVLTPHNKTNSCQTENISFYSNEFFSTSAGDGTWDNGVWSAQLMNDADSDYVNMNNSNGSWSYCDKYSGHWNGFNVSGSVLQTTEDISVDTSAVRTFTAPMTGTVTINESIVKGGASDTYIRIVKEDANGNITSVWPVNRAEWPYNGYNYSYAWIDVIQPEISNIMLNAGDKLHFEMKKQYENDSMTSVTWENGITYTDYPIEELPYTDGNIRPESYKINCYLHTYDRNQDEFEFTAPRNGTAVLEAGTVTGGGSNTVVRIEKESADGSIEGVWPGDRDMWPVWGYQYLHQWTPIDRPDINIDLIKGDKIRFIVKKINDTDEGSQINWDNTLRYSDIIIYSDIASSSDSATAEGFINNGYGLVWSDEFSGNELDKSIWRQRTEHPDNDSTIILEDERVIKVSDGVLRMESIKYSDPSDPNIEYAFPRGITSGYIQSKPETYDGNGLAYRYGYLEMRARGKFTRGNALSLWGQSFNHLADHESKLSDIGMELDVFETMGHADGTAQPNLWLWGPWDNATSSQEYEPYNYYDPQTGMLRESNSNIVSSDVWHTFGFEWTPQNIVMYYDGTPYMTYDITKNFSSNPGLTDGEEGFHSPLDIIIGAAPVVDSWDDSLEVAADTSWPMYIEIDYIRLYQNDKFTHTYPDGTIVGSELWTGEGGTQ